MKETCCGPRGGIQGALFGFPFSVSPLIILLLVSASPSHSQVPWGRFIVPLSISNGSQTVRDTFGFFEHATPCIDGQLDTNLTEVGLPPPPPSILLARFIDYGPSFSCLDFGLRLNLQDFWVLDTFRLQITQPPSGMYPITVSWSRIADHGAIMDVLLITDIHGGTTINTDMLRESSIQIDSASELALQIVGIGVVSAVEDERPPIPSKVFLAQNYPNPFNPSTTIRYAIPSGGPVSLTVADQLGRIVRTLVSAVEQPGYHDASFDGSLLPSGEYYYVLRWGDAVQTKKLLLLK